jgi:hypothetical protein
VPIAALRARVAPDFHAVSKAIALCDGDPAMLFRTALASLQLVETMRRDADVLTAHEARLATTRLSIAYAALGEILSDER